MDKIIKEKMDQLLMDLIWLQANIINFYTPEFRGMFSKICERAEELLIELRK